MPTDGLVALDAHLRKLFDHLAWADKRVLDSLRTMLLPDARALELYAHVLGAEHVWLSRMLEHPAEHEVWPRLSLNGADQLAAENAAALRSFVAGCSRAKLETSVAYTNSAGLPFESTIEDMLLQVVLHGCYHRGQVALLVRGANGEPAPTDYIAFVRGAPAAVWPPAK